MNYRHAFHAGNFADVLKHFVLSRIVLYLQKKEKPFRVIDTHAGRGRYELSSSEAQRTGEWRDGIGRVLDAELPAPVAELLAPYLATIKEDADGFSAYPGSPLVARRLLRKQDRLTAIELHPRDSEALRSLFAGDFQVRVIHLDGWLALNSQLPPKEKRGVVLVDPPFEEPDEFDRLVEGLKTAHSRWPGGTYALWYPIKDRKAVARFREALKGSGIPDIIDVTIDVRAPSPEPKLDGCGMVVVNPPYTLEAELAVVLPVLRDLLAQGDGAAATVTRLAKEAQPG
ncbi:23S rRNA (adenine(2030)-N(6))-methyltransferase RlmJ [Mesorhizobium sp. RP14(2022)]|uniref:Ribosomal RNA large subunit methyltransferase J n=1 Tax=Mesorhizobium liriopis TaxID=2953882 RepID=A0ABT1C801_9HYPH|nr:23S rRNA (adenine(2030)-N(6))-methyltransferase RlmJ [Mesorhizobium liriopis]MCO6050902.1 23S rRNA (adenine(2030)-N(6))-methyltransferase RlmJ [Mesorhizobium liriopis]